MRILPQALLLSACQPASPPKSGTHLESLPATTDGCDMAVHAGDNHTCALLDDGSIKCWGLNLWGQLGLGDTADHGDGPGEMGDSLPAVSLGTGRTATAVTAGTGHTCALLDDGSVKCWGDNFLGTLGLGDDLDRGDGPNEMGDVLPAVSLGTGRTATAVTAGAMHTCALLDDGTVKCWGVNWSGQLGVAGSYGQFPNEMGDALPAVSLGIGRAARAVTAGADHTCALLDDGTVKCWGDNEFGQLGLGDSVDRSASADQMGDALPAVSLGAGRTATALSAGARHNCALLDDSSVKCWGINNNGELGLGDRAWRGDDPDEMGDALPAVDLGAEAAARGVTAGANYSCGLRDDGKVKCWGYNVHGQLGHGDTATSGFGTDKGLSLGAGRTVTGVTAGGSHTCALLDCSAVKCWGFNFYGQLGLEDTADRGDGPHEMGDALPEVEL